MARGTFRVYLGAAPGVGKTFDMLNEGWRRAKRGTDVVIGYVETHGRAQTSSQVRDLEIIPRRSVTYRGQVFEEMDLDAVVARKAHVVLVDELAHTNVPGSRQRQALGGRGRTTGCGRDSHHHGEHPAPRVPE